MKTGKGILLIFLFLFMSVNHSKTQDLSYSIPGKNIYTEMQNPKKADPAEWAKLTNNIMVSYADDNVRYAKEKVPSIAESLVWLPRAWKGEKIHTQILVWAKQNIPALSITVKSLKNEKGNVIDIKNIKAAFVRYVMTDEFGEGCGERKKTDFDSSLVEDPIDIVDQISVQSNTVQPLWLSIQVPGDIPAGKYSGIITINADKKLQNIKFRSNENHTCL